MEQISEDEGTTAAIIRTRRGEAVRVDLAATSTRAEDDLAVAEREATRGPLAAEGVSSTGGYMATSRTKRMCLTVERLAAAMAMDDGNTGWDAFAFVY
ncbi:hypothetical protein CMUS01_01304 [Colletotrichum musicola]|uniref:Uncharacterized protein n=1 Tax=Colletotrichum musicola TaxID=2175873 RepID=A0A8H6NX85_9PEZI|nr:hypothetical protein CMUS01_01304 [Colletotrichum musicola]